MIKRIGFGWRERGKGSLRHAVGALLRRSTGLSISTENEPRYFLGYCDFLINLSRVRLHCHHTLPKISVGESGQKRVGA